MGHDTPIYHFSSIVRLVMPVTRFDQLLSTICKIWGNNILEEYMKFGETSICIGFPVAGDTPPRV